jgi:phosphohistidine phosphatase
MPMPELLVSSGAVRALNTALIFARTFGIKESDVKIEEKIYESNVATWLKIISQFDNQCNSIMLFGHNPTMTNLANEINNELLFDNIPTCGIVSLGLDINDWKEILAKKEGKLLNYKFPKSFKQ